jgi:hypothetical protein
MFKVILGGLLVLASAAASAAGLAPTQIAGRWTGDDRTSGRITLDIVACGSAWCGVKVEAGDKCGGTALKVEFVEALGQPSNSLQFNGTLELAPGTKPYVVQAWLVPPSEKRPLKLQIAGDTGAVYREYLRSFPFDAQLARVGDAVCRAPQTVSSLQ